MNAIVQSQLDRVEAALNILIESITAYNPSVPAAHALLAVDDDLTEDLHLRMSSPPWPSDTHGTWLSSTSVSNHQRNYAHVLSLRASTDALDKHTIETLALLSRTRAELIATSATPPNVSVHRVPYPELLNHARNISKYTVSPTFRPVPRQASQQTRHTPNLSQPVNGASESFASSSTQAIGASQGNTGTTSTTTSVEAKSGHLGVSLLSDAEHRWLNPVAQALFLPWPSEEIIRLGALAQIQGKIERGEDPTKVEEAGIVMMDEEVGRRDVKWEAHERGVGMIGEDQEAVQKRPADRVREEKPDVFGGLDLYDPDEE